jgi:lipopolysaccharide export LptBFGC system permease protein LptF
MERVIDPALADLQAEYGQVSNRDTWKRRWILLRGYCALFKVVCLCGASSLRPANWNCDDRASLKRVLRVASAAMIIATGLLLVPTVSRQTDGGFSNVRLVGIAAWLVASLPLAVPIGVLFGVLFGLRNRVVSGTSVIVILVACLVLAAATRVNLAWVLPWANQSFRTSVSGRPDIPRGSRELTLSELREWIRQEEDFPNSKGFRRNSLEYHERGSALPAAPLVLALFGLSVVSRRRNGRAYLMSLALFGGFLYWVALMLGQVLTLEGFFEPIINAWLANIVLLVISAAIVLASPLRSTASLTRSGSA